jgi:hypothetical protein
VNKICTRRSYQSDRIKVNVDKEKLSVRIRCHISDASQANSVAMDMIRKVKSTSRDAGAAANVQQKPQPQKPQPQKPQQPAKAMSFASVTKFAPAGLKPAPASPDMEAFRKATLTQQSKNTSFVKMSGANYEPAVNDENQDPWMNDMRFNIVNFKSARESREAELRQFLQYEMETDFDYQSMENIIVPINDGLPWNVEGVSWGDEIFA